MLFQVDFILWPLIAFAVLYVDGIPYPGISHVVFETVVPMLWFRIATALDFDVFFCG